ncbi:hypothetical protein, partial [Ochrobactrum teleogrylli]|uniref:hypothetical protein n=1 Tax=Ochrobactrum teleogrylli TaxID=2479765 RepID=UPI001AEE9558
ESSQPFLTPSCEGELLGPLNNTVAEEARRAVSKDRPSRLRFAPHLRVRGVALDKEVRRAAIKKARWVIEILVMTRRKWCFSRTGAECTLGYMSTGSEEKRHLQAVSA